MNIILKEIFLFSLSMCAILIFLTGCNNDNELRFEDKTNAEIDYLENYIFLITNKYLKNEYMVENEINWNDIENDVRNINNSTDTILLDFSEYDISKDDLLEFRNKINNLIVVVENKDETSLLTATNELYRVLPVLLEKYSQDINKINIMKLKSLVLESLTYSNTLDWENAKLTIDMAESKYTEMINNIDFIKQYEDDINKIYVLLEEVKNAIYMEEIELTKFKYINIIEKI